PSARTSTDRRLRPARAREHAAWRARGVPALRPVLKLALLALVTSAHAQVAPSPGELAGYSGLFVAAATRAGAAIKRLAASGTGVNAKDARGRTPIIVAAFAKQREVMQALAAAGADVNALDDDRYDMVTIAAVADDMPTLATALAIGNRATN